MFYIVFGLFLLALCLSSSKWVLCKGLNCLNVEMCYTDKPASPLTCGELHAASLCCCKDRFTLCHRSKRSTVVPPPDDVSWCGNILKYNCVMVLFILILEHIQIKTQILLPQINPFNLIESLALSPQPNRWRPGAHQWARCSCWHR